jgi:WD40 repeat protein
MISCSYDKTIKVWKVDCLKNVLMFLYTLENRHTNFIYSICLNESETALVSCG